MWRMTAFAASALLLAMVGVYGLLSYAVEQRSHEMGIRMALGAAAGKIRSLVVLQGMVLTTIAAYFLTRLLAGFLFGVTGHDPLVFSTAPLFLAVISHDTGFSTGGARNREALKVVCFLRAGDGDRTRDVQLGKVAMN